MPTLSELDGLGFTALAERLSQVRATRTPAEWGTDNAVFKSSLERRFLAFVCARAVVEDESQVQVEHEIEVEVERRRIEVVMASIRPGGLWIPSKTLFKNGSPAIVKIRTKNNHPLKVKCVVRNREGDPHGIALAFEDLEGISQRRAERLILELLKSYE